MYQYKFEKVLKLKGNRLYVVLDLGFDIQVTKSFELSRVEEPELDFSSNISDPELSMRSFVIGWLKTAPRPLYVHMEKFNDDYEGEILDRNGNNLADDLFRSYSSEATQVIDYGLPQATEGPGLT